MEFADMALDADLRTGGRGEESDEFDEPFDKEP